MSKIVNRLDTIEERLRDLEDQYEEITHNTDLRDRKYEKEAKRQEGEHEKVLSASNVSSHRMEQRE